ncbi:ATP-binding protein [Clostridium saccharoperbutylacetonicum]|uniref:ATP-binding protein n=1 Tax=Clostridium saccharoperbutylacetonicum TaxID=36745 RepID=UPI000983B67D|nr:ATP-binding protein [Clostridium saccharoperbutylacetonicum]AQR98135.1 hypothetical protein CLSAP_54860 [Clostridium saccharoperbutylacetonicum]NSB34028.1 hypothetical protein [Clostridium saccharoperbutylacetonicum]
MAIKTLILGESGTGKSTSLRNFDPGEVCYINPAKKPLPFKGKFEALTGTTDIRQISKFIRASNKKIVIVDDGQYLMSFPYMQRLKETGWDKYNDIQSDYFQLFDLADNLPDDVTVYFLSHIQIMDDGRQKIKTIGKMLDEKITIEGMFTTVLKTYVSDGKYYFLTQNSGNDTVKSPMGMFPTFAIDNDLNYVDEKIRNYYEIGEDFKSDEEMKKADEKVKNEEIEKPVDRKARRNKDKGKDEKPKRERKVKEDKIEVVEGDPIPFDEVPDSEFNPPVENKRKSRKKSEE